ncbi:SDR family oxidoreductase [Pseudomonas typographi]|uniref:SDR family oxidoreductase n=1 Tax=Pseudomonas typographi TaxID=2715964 RepID=UPI001687AF11|nr:SDR family oxidoreductase [Pseudomonas typographi]MBD1550519.1 SDR family oxidoreductase [Pseudomonas typographi]
MANPDILIVAAERGLGLGLTKQFLQRGWSVFATAFPGSDLAGLEEVRRIAPGRLQVGHIDVTDPEQIEPLKKRLGSRMFDVIYLNAGIFGPLHQSVVQATAEELRQIMMVNAFGPIRLARNLLGHLKTPGALAFMSSHRGSVAANVEGGLELYRASKASLNILARGIYADIREQGNTVLTIHPGWAATSMGTLDGTVEAEIDVDASVRGVADVVEHHRHSGEHLYLDYEDRRWPW